MKLVVCHKYIPYLYLFVYLCRCYLQKRVLNRSKGPAVWALRAQTDKREYAMEMKKVVERFAPAACLQESCVIIFSRKYPPNALGSHKDIAHSSPLLLVYNGYIKKKSGLSQA